MRRALDVLKIVEDQLEAARCFGAAYLVAEARFRIGTEYLSPRKAGA
jgi:hypothetical protein